MNTNRTRQKSTPVVNIGSSSLLVIFLILALVIFAVLTLSSATSDYHFSERTAARTTEYYAAVSKAEATWDDFDNALQEGALAGESVITYAVPINDSQELSVELTLVGNDTDGYHYDVTKWQTVSTKEWTGDNKVTLIK